MKKFILGAVTALVLNLTISNTATAVPADFVDNGGYTTDTLSNLDWLDVTTTVNMSVNDVLAQVGSGGTYEGWRYATGLQFNTLVSNWTGTVINTLSQVLHPEGAGSIDGLIDLLGSTLDSYYLATYSQTYDAYFGYAEGEGLDKTLGFLADDGTIIGTKFFALIYDDDSHSASVNFTTTNHIMLPNNYADAQIGSFLIRDTQISAVPLPPAIILFGAALAGLGFVGHRKKHAV